MIHLKRLFFAITFCCAVLSAVTPAEAQRRKSVFDDEPTQPKTDNPRDPASGSAARPTPTNTDRSTDPNFFDKGKASDEDKFAPEIVTMTVKEDRVLLVATWYPPILEEEDEEAKPKQAADPNIKQEAKPEAYESIAPFILIHDWTRSRSDMLPLAEFLQSQGHAVLVPDLRGHGDSVVVEGVTGELDYKKFKKTQQASAVADIDQCKRFLQKKNNDKELNIDMLNVIAVGDSSHLAMAWAISDWNWGPVAGIKQGKDVKSLVLFSPTKTFAGSSLKKLSQSPLFSGRAGSALPMLVIWGAQSSVNKDCSDFIRTLRKNRPETAQDAGLEARWAEQDLFDFEAPTSMQGRELAGSPKAKQIWSFANDFVSQKVMALKDQFPWQTRGAKAILKARGK